MDAALAQLIDRVRAAAASGERLRVRGGGTKDFLGDAGQGDLLDTTAWRGITSYEPSELFVTARCGTPLAELEAALAQRGQCLPFEPPHGGAGATVGGMVAAGLAGPARASVGAVRDYVLGAQLVNGRGELLVFGGQVMKNVAGYDVSRVLAGSRGRLGVIAEVSLKVLAVAPAEATLRFELSQAEALERLHGWGGRPLPLNASCWVADAGVGTLYLRLRGAVAAVESACAALGGERQPQASSAADWAACREQTLPWFNERGNRDLWRLSVPQTAPVLDLPEPPFVEWHGGQRWVRAASADAERVRRAARAAGGHATLFRTERSAPGQRTAAPDAVLAAIERRLQLAFDPAGVFQPPAPAASS